MEMGIGCIIMRIDEYRLPGFHVSHFFKIFMSEVKQLVLAHFFSFA